MFKYLEEPIPITSQRWNEDTAPIVSISCITYNHEKYIRDAIEGFLMQKTTFPVEILIHDDASTDSTADIIRVYEQKYPQLIKPIYQTENQYSKGIGVSVIYQYPRARGKYIAMCEGDDYWIDSFKLQKQVDAFKKYPGMTLSFCNKRVVNDINGGVYNTKIKNRKYTREDILGGVLPGIQSMMYLRSTIVGINFSLYPHINGDRLIPYLVLSEGYARSLPDVMAVYRISGKGVATSLLKEMNIDEWFKHSSDDFNNFHRNTGFKSKKAYIKGMSAYVYKYLSRPGRHNGHLIRHQTSKYEDKVDYIMYIRILLLSYSKLLQYCIIKYIKLIISK